jgi:hypothetical protein
MKRLRSSPRSAYTGYAKLIFRVRDVDAPRGYRYRSNVYTEDLAFLAVKEAVRTAQTQHKGTK